MDLKLKRWVVQKYYLAAGTRFLTEPPEASRKFWTQRSANAEAIRLNGIMRRNFMGYRFKAERR